MAFGRRLWSRFKKVVDALITVAVVAVVGTFILAGVGVIAAFGAGLIIAGGLPMAVVLGAGLLAGTAITKTAIKNNLWRNENPGMYPQQHPDPQTRRGNSSPASPYKPPQSPKKTYNNAAAPQRGQNSQSSSSEAEFNTALARFNAGQGAYPLR